MGYGASFLSIGLDAIRKVNGLLFAVGGFSPSPRLHRCWRSVTEVQLSLTSARSCSRACAGVVTETIFA